MNEQDRVSMLKTKHTGLEEEIVLENKHPQPDEVIVADLKRQKLRIKDELASMNAL
ncbi:MAG: YdcH family protein [Rhodospirillaceae bacterium]|jgi:hypothetical protein|nr:YdcH family protein [Rhodospirillaceae bacterium]MBT4937816.1 YdcH family protein [Rhodospirillaceae bacterium]MBT5940350.1 YdcH family protein [Rhodospirillaceae bacterium]MBT7267533.1 YdcH family protein [Rhodospirillaceae bacterium]